MIAPASVPLMERLDRADRTLLPVLAVLLDQADADGGLTLAELVSGYRRMLETAGTADSGGSLPAAFSEGVLARVQDVVLPSLVRGGWILDAGAEGWHRIQAVPEWWREAVSMRARLARAVADRLHSSRLSKWDASGNGVVHAAESTAVLRGEGLEKSFKRRRVVKEVSLSLAQGEVVGLLGPNGAGKTTTFYLLTGLIRPDAGRIFLDARDLTGEPMFRRARAGIGYLAQEPSVFRRMTVEENLLAILETRPLTRVQQHERLERLLDELGLTSLRRAKAYALSGGERRRLELTRALVTEPKFMLLDEPFAGIDPIAVHDIQGIVAGLRARGIGVLITDHSVEQTLEIVDRAYIMFEGSVQAAGTVRDLVFNDQVADLYLGPTLTTRLRHRMGSTT